MSGTFHESTASGSSWPAGHPGHLPEPDSLSGAQGGASGMLDHLLYEVHDAGFRSITDIIHAPFAEADDAHWSEGRSFFVDDLNCQITPSDEAAYRRARDAWYGAYTSPPAGTCPIPECTQPATGGCEVHEPAPTALREACRAAYYAEHPERRPSADSTEARG